MIPVWLALALMATPCNSELLNRAHETVVSQCPLQHYVYGPTTPPGWTAPVVKPTKKVVKKKKQRRKKRRK